MSQSTITTIVLFRNDLRIKDNPALHHAVLKNQPIIPLFVWAPSEQAPWQPGAAQAWWLHHSLQALSRSLIEKKTPLVVRQGATLSCLLDLAKETGAKAVFWNRSILPSLQKMDRECKTELQRAGIKVEEFSADLLHAPDQLQTGSGAPYKVFTPFWKKFKGTCEILPPLPPPSFSNENCYPTAIPSDTIASLGLLPQIDWADGIRVTWTPGEDAAHQRLTYFNQNLLANYPDDRNRPDRDGTSCLSPHLRFGELSPRQVWHAIDPDAPGSSTYLREIGWREFGYHLLHHFPHTTYKPLREKYERFPWKQDKKALERWQRGETGYPIVDAGMRQLWQTGWMHNRVRMIVASFLTKDLLIPWQEGAKWFWDTLVDADLANNTLGWQWAAGSGADAQPFFRIFNPTSQGEKFDPQGTYVKKWVPELEMVPKKMIHQPWNLSPLEKQTLHYIDPIVDHKKARAEALEAYEQIK